MATTNTLTWTKNTELDVAKYNVYRQVGSPPTKSASNLQASVPATSNTYVDTVTVDATYYYGITAVDTSNNESPLSTVVNKLVDSNPPQAPIGLTVV